MADGAATTKLTTRQELFVAAYLGDARGNATEAARMAGFKQPQSQGPRLLKNVAISARVKAHVQTFASADRVLEELTDVGLAPWRDFVEILKADKDGNPLLVKFDLSAKVKSLELLGKYHQLFADKQIIDMNIRDHRVIGVPQDTLDAMFTPANRLDA